MLVQKNMEGRRNRGKEEKKRREEKIKERMIWCIRHNKKSGERRKEKGWEAYKT